MECWYLLHMYATIPRMTMFLTAVIYVLFRSLIVTSQLLITSIFHFALVVYGAALYTCNFQLQPPEWWMYSRASLYPALVLVFYICSL